MRNIFAQMRTRRAAGLFGRRRPTPLPTVQAESDVDTRWGWGLVACGFILALLSMAVLLEDDEYLIEMSVQAQEAYYDGLVEGFQRGRAFMREQMIDAWNPRALAGEQVVCPLPASPSAAEAQRRASRTLRSDTPEGGRP